MINIMNGEQKEQNEHNVVYVEINVPVHMLTFVTRAHVKEKC